MTAHVQLHASMNAYKHACVHARGTKTHRIIYMDMRMHTRHAGQGQGWCGLMALPMLFVRTLIEKDALFIHSNANTDKQLLQNPTMPL